MERTEDSVSEQRSERSRPSTPKWWRPNYPPETYLWEEMRRKRQKGGYPWTLLDRENDEDEDGFVDHLYEPVNPPPLYGSGYMGKDHDTGSLDGRLLDIPPEMDIVSSEGLDGLDQPDPHDLFGIDGDKEWNLHPEEEKTFSSMSKSVFTAGIRKRDLPKHGETSSIRPLTNKGAGEAGEVQPIGIVGADQEVPMAPDSEPQPSSSKATALQKLKTRAGQVKQRISKISLPTRPKFNMKLGRRKKKGEEPPPVEMDDIEADFRRVPVADEIIEPTSIMKPFPEAPGRTTPLTIPTEAKTISFQPQSEECTKDLEGTDEEVKAVKAKPLAEKQEQERLIKEAKAAEEEETKRLKAEEKLHKEQVAEELKKQKLEEKLQKDQAEAELKKVKLEEKLQKDQAEAELRKVKAEEKLQKDQAEAELKKVKAEEKAAKDRAKEETKRLKAEEKALKEKQDEELRKAKAEEKLVKEMHELELKKLKVETEMEEMGPSPAPSTSHSAGLDKVRAIEQFEQDLESEIMLNSPDSAPQTPTPKKPSTTGMIKRKLADIDIKKRFKRSKTPPPRPEQPKFKFKRRGLGDDETQNQLGAQYKTEIAARDAELEAEHGRVPETQIFVTQPSVESETHGEWVPPSRHRTQSGHLEEALEEDEEEAQAPSSQNFGAKLKGLGQKSKAIAAQTSKGLGRKMKVIGHDLREFGGKVNVKCKESIKEIKAKQEAARQRNRKERPEDEEEEEEAEPRQTFRFKRRPRDEAEPKPFSDQPVIVGSQRKVRGPREPPSEYESGTGPSVPRSHVLGRADRDWESPLEPGHSRDPSEEPGFSAHASSGWESPVASSVASSSVQRGRRQGVLEEIDSDEFFLRERGISEGEDEEEINRFLVQELRQAFRPAHANALTGFDLPIPPERPARAGRKQPSHGSKSPNFQTFPPERPKRKQTPGYISSYMETQAGGESFEEEEAEEPKLAEFVEDEEDFMRSEEDEDEGIRRVKEELRKIDLDLEEDGRYEPVNESPLRPQRSKKRKPKTRSPPPILYYNTIAANEWMKDVEDQITDEIALGLVDEKPVAPKRERRRSTSQSRSQLADSEIQFADDEPAEEEVRSRAVGEQPPLAQAESAGQFEDIDDLLDLMDESGYAVVQKEPERPTTVPRRKKKCGKAGTGNKRHSLKRRSQDGGTSSGPMYFSLPRYTPRTFHIVPPSRPHRTYSTLRPKRPPRRKVKPGQKQQEPDQPHPVRKGPGIREGTGSLHSEGNKDKDDSRPSTAIGIMQGRPLPPPPRPTRSPVPPQNDLDQASLERMVGVRHYANFAEDDNEGDGPDQRAVVEEICTAKNITLLGGEEEEESELANSEVNIGIQTDPLREEDFELNTMGSFDEEEDRIQRLRDSIQRVSSDDREDLVPRQANYSDPIQRISSDDRDGLVPRQVAYPPVPVSQVRTTAEPIDLPPAHAPPIQTQVIFPTRLHLSELEVDFLRVNELTAHSVTMDRLETPHLQVSSLTSSGPLSVPLIQSPSLTADHLYTERLTSSSTDIPTMSLPPPSFYQLASPNLRQRSLCLDSEDLGEEEAGSAQDQPEGQSSASEPLQKPVRPPTVSRTRSSRAEGGESEDVLQLSMRLGRALLRAGMRTIEAMTDYIDSSTSSDPECQQQQRNHLQVMICLLLLLVTGIFLMTRSGPAPHRWEFYLPPHDFPPQT